MFTVFLKQQWTGFWRSKGKSSTIVAQAVIAFVALYIVGLSLFIGINMEELFEELLPGKDVYIVFNGVILYYFGLDFLARLQMQELPAIAIVPYLHLNIPKKKIVWYLNIRALFSVFNILPLLIFLPFCILHLPDDFGLFACLMYIVTICSLMLFNNYAALYFKRVSAENMTIVIIGLFFMAAIAVMEYFRIFSIAAISNLFFQAITAYPTVGCAAIALATTMFLINYRYLAQHLYIDEIRSVKTTKTVTDYSFLNHFGLAGTLAALEIKLILRNKRPRATVAKGLLLLFYGLLLYKQETIEANEFWKLLATALLMTSNVLLIYGQMMFGWQSAEFDGMLAKKISVTVFFEAKILLLTLASSVLTLIVSLYGFLSWKILLMQFALYFYNTGIGTIIVLYFATRNYKSIDLSKGASFNWQGVGATTMILALPIMLSPYIIYLPLALIHPYWGLAGLAITGLMGIVTRKFWLGLLVRAFNERKYKIAAGFREKSS